jgi:hypothetical protein
LVSRAAGLGKNQESVKRMDNVVHSKLPFDVICYHSDNDKTILKILFEKIKGSDGKYLYHRLLENDSLTENQKQILIKTFTNLNMVKLRNEIDELTSKLYNIQLRKNNSNFNDINMIQPVHSFNDNLL